VDITKRYKADGTHNKNREKITIVKDNTYKPLKNKST
jgi:hypothetical protein